MEPKEGFIVNSKKRYVPYDSMLDMDAGIIQSMVDEMNVKVAKDLVSHILIGKPYLVILENEALHEPRIMGKTYTSKMAMREIVQCKNCRKWHEEIGWCDEHSYFVDSEGMACSPAESPSWKMFPPDYFCKDGEKKNDD